MLKTRINNLINTPSYSPLFFSMITCIGGVHYGFIISEFSQIMDDYPFANFHQNINDVNYSLFTILFPAGNFLGTLLAGYCTFQFGRVITLFSTDIMTILVIIISISFNRFEPFFIGRFLLGIICGINFPVMLLLIRELVLEKDYLKCIIFFQVSNTIGIFLCNLISLSKKWNLALGISIILPIIRSIYFYFKFVRIEIDTPLYMLNYKDNNDKECYQKLKKVYPEYHIEELISFAKKQETLLKKNFYLGNMFIPEYMIKLAFCISVFFLNQSSGINFVLCFADQFFPNSGKISIIFSAINFIGGISLFFTIPPKMIKGTMRHFIGISFIKGFYRFVIGMVMILGILIYFAYGLDYKNESEMSIFATLGGIYLLIFQNCNGLYPYIYIPVLLPDIGIFMVLVIYSTFSFVCTLAFLFGWDGSSGVFRFCFIMSVVWLILVVILFKIYLEGKFHRDIDSVDKIETIFKEHYEFDEKNSEECKRDSIFN